MNYSELSTAIQDYTENYEASFVANIPTFVEQAEQRIYNSVQFPSLRKNVTGNVTISNPFLNCPNDFLAAHSLAVVDADGNFEYLLNKDVNFIRQAYPKVTDAGLPKYYAIYGPQSGDAKELTFVVGPTPDANYDVVMHYFYYPESIVTAGTSWLGDNFDTVLLYGALVEAYTFMKGEADLLTLYNTKYNEALMLAKRLGDGLERQDSYRSGQVRVPVN
jgi:hypothetical protein